MFRCPSKDRIPQREKCLDVQVIDRIIQREKCLDHNPHRQIEVIETTKTNLCSPPFPPNNKRITTLKYKSKPMYIGMCCERYKHRTGQGSWISAKLRWATDISTN